jgi:hypothetical protein
MFRETDSFASPRCIEGNFDAFLGMSTKISCLSKWYKIKLFRVVYHGGIDSNENVDALGKEK